MLAEYLPTVIIDIVHQYSWQLMIHDKGPELDDKYVRKLDRMITQEEICEEKHEFLELFTHIYLMQDTGKGISNLKVLDNIIINGHINITKFLIEKNIPFGKMDLYNACKYGHIDMVELFVYKCNIHIPASAVTIACMYGNIELLKYLYYDHNIMFTEQDFCVLSDKGHTNIIEWLESIGINAPYWME